MYNYQSLKKCILQPQDSITPVRMTKTKKMGEERSQIMPSTGEGVKELELCYTANGNVKLNNKKSLAVSKKGKDTLTI